MQFTIGELRVVVGKDYRLYFGSPIGNEKPNIPSISAEDIKVLQSKLSEVLQHKMLNDIANETDEQKGVRKNKSLDWLETFKESTDELR